MKRSCLEALGPLGERTFGSYCKQLALAGWMHGWHHPLLLMEHMDDPRSPYCVLETDEDLRTAPSLTADLYRVRTLEERVRQIQSVALLVQKADTDPRRHFGWRRWVRRGRRAVANVVSLRSPRTPRFWP
jgi:hypothetical protein